MDLEKIIEIYVEQKVQDRLAQHQQSYYIRVFDGDWDETDLEEPLLWKGYMTHIPQTGDILHLRDDYNVAVIRRQVFVDSVLCVDVFTEGV